MMFYPKGLRAYPDALARLYGLGWAVMLVLLLAPWLLLATAEKNSSATRVADPAVVAAQALWGDERVLDAAWAEQARQWPKNHANSAYAQLPLLRAWSDLDETVLTLQVRTKQVLKFQSIQTAYELLEPYTQQGHPEIRRLANLMQSRMQSLMNKPFTTGDERTLVLSWGQLEGVLDDLNQIQVQLTEIRRWSMMVPNNDKLPMRFYVQMSLAFPSVNVREFRDQAFLLIKNRLAIENAIAQTQLSQWALAPVQPVTIAPWRWALAVLCTLLGVAWMVFLGKGYSRLQQLHAQRAEDISDMERRLEEAQLPPPAVLPPPPAEPAPAATVSEPAWTAQVRASIPDLLGRVKNIQRLFDSGHSQELVARDLSIVEAKLVQWDKAAQDAQTPPTGA